MKNCTITFKIGDTDLRITFPEEEFYGVEGERSLPTQDFQDRLAALISKHSGQWQDIKNSIIQYLKDNSAVSTAVTYAKISGKDGLVPNVSYKYIQDTYPEIEFPDIDVPILLLDTLDVTSKFPVMGRVLDKKGKEIFVVRGDKDSLVKLSNYLKTREKVLSGEYESTLDEELKGALNKIAEKQGLSKEETILQYLNNIKEFKKDKSLIDGASQYVWMSYIVGAIKGTPAKRRYTNPVINEFNRRLTTNKYGQKVLTISELNAILSQAYPHIFTTQKSLLEVFQKKAGEAIEYISELKNLNEEEKDFLAKLIEERTKYLARHTEDDTDQWAMTTLFNAINSLLEPNENPLALRPVHMDKKALILEDRYPTLESAYGFGYDTVASFTKEEDRNGYHIYSQTKEIGDRTVTYYYVTKYFINEKLQARRFGSIDEAQEWIDNHFIQQKLKENAFSNLKQEYTDGKVDPRLGRSFLSETFIPEGTIFSALDVPLDLRSQSMQEEEFFLLNKSLQDFYDYIESLNLLNTTKQAIYADIDTAEKATIFLSEINRVLNTTDEAGNKIYPREDPAPQEGEKQVTTVNDKIKAVVNDIKTKQPTYYYVSTSYKVDEGKYRIRFIETDETAVTEKRHNKRTPVLQLLSSIVSTMKEKFGVPVEIVNEEKLTEMGIEDINLVKAFIKDGTIYINSATARASDAFHEYAHLLLGVLKSNPDYRQNYLDFIEKILSTENGQKAYNRRVKRYPNANAMDLAEETVADLYGQYMEGNLPYELSSLFAQNDDLKKVTDTIFDKKDKAKNVLEFDGSLEGIWKRFNSEVAKTLGDNINFIRDEALQVQRRKDTWIRDQIEKKNIIEDCE